MTREELITELEKMATDFEKSANQPVWPQSSEEVSFYEGGDRAYGCCADELRDLITRAKSTGAEV